LPSQKELKWSQLKVGILVISALAALTVLIFLMSGSTGGLFTRKVTFRAFVENANGLKVGAPVTLDGVTIGNVTSIKILPHHQPDSVEVVVRVGAQYLPSLHTDSTAAILSAGVLGDSFMDISSNHATGPEPPDNSILKVVEAPGIPDVIKTSQETAQEAIKVIKKLSTTMDLINSGKGTAGVMMNDPELAKKIVLSINQLQSVTSQLANGKGTLGKLITDDQLYDRANSTIEKLNSVVDRLDKGEGTAGKLLKDDSLYKNLNSAVENTNSLLAGINSGNGALGKLAKDPLLAKQVEESVTHLNSILKDIDEGKGSVGQLVQNRSLYDNADKTLKDTGDLVTAIRQDPKKYLTIRVKLF